MIEVVLDNSKAASLQFESLSQSLQLVNTHDLLSKPFNVIKNAVPSKAVILSCDERSKSLPPDSERRGAGGTVILVRRSKLPILEGLNLVILVLSPPGLLT
jgi:hypothetical protein